MATEYEVLRGEGISGPFTGAKLRKMASEGELSRDDKIRAVGSAEWQLAGRASALFPAPPPNPLDLGIDTGAAPAKPERPAARSSPSSTASASSTGTLPAPAVATATPSTVEADVPRATGRPSPAQLALASATGLILALGLSLLKPSLGAVAMIGIVAALGLVLAAIVLSLRTTAAPLALQLGPNHPVAAAARARVGQVTCLGGAALLAAGLLTAAELLTPKDGLVRTALGMRTSKPPEPPTAPPPVPPLDRKAWAGAHFVLVNPGQNAVAIRHDPDKQAFSALAFASPKQVSEAMKLAVSNGIQIVTEKPDLAERISTIAEPGPIPGLLGSELGKLWRIHQYLPPKPTLVTFQDVKEGSSRVGFLVDRRPEEITFVPLAPRWNREGSSGDPFTTEIVRRADVRTGSQRVGLSDAQVRELADFLDYSVFRILEKLGTTQRGAGYVRVVVEPVEYDDTKLKGIKEQAANLAKRYLAELKLKAKYGVVDEQIKGTRKGNVKARQTRKKSRLGESQTSQSNPNPYANNSSLSQFGSTIDSAFGGPPGAPTRKERSTENEDETTDTDVDFEEALDLIRNRSIRGDDEAKAFLHKFDLEESRLRDIEAETGTVTTELRTRLGNAGVSVLERTRLDLLEAERQLAQASLSPGAAEQYLGATHVLITEMRDRRGPGQYHLATRLVKVGTREIVAEVEGERTPPLSVAYTPPVDTPFLLGTGQLVVVEFNDDVRPRTDLDYRDYPGGYPVNLPFTEVVPVSTDDKQAEYDRLRILKVRGKPGPAGKINKETPPILAEMSQRIGFMDDADSPDPKQSPYRVLVGKDLSADGARQGLPFKSVPFRDLFGTETVKLELSKVKLIREVTSNIVPEAHRMRYITYQIAAAILPPAGRVISRGENDLLTVSLGHRSAIAVGNRLRVLRPGSSDRLDFDLQVRETQNDYSRVTFDPNEHIFADRYGPQVGDIVHRRTDQTISVAFLPFKVEDTNDNAGNNNAPNRGMAPNRTRRSVVIPQPGRIVRPAPRSPDVGFRAQRAFNEEKTTSTYITKLANELEGKLREALRGRCNVPLADPQNATHVVEGRVTFSSDTDYLVPAHLTIKERASGKILHEIDFPFTEQEGRKWKP